MIAAPDVVHTAIDYTLRQDRGRLIAALTAAIGDFELAEECLQDAIETALEMARQRDTEIAPWLAVAGGAAQGAGPVPA
ncbi:hypothetical protein [Profundibacter sp.]|uniref:hypothetical protein n=1 Tax=Profundibacter sp. TaxID=3101071 RepID=UPI003D130FC0